MRAPTARPPSRPAAPRRDTPRRATGLLAALALLAAPAAADDPVIQYPHHVQGRAHISPLVGRIVSVRAVVTVVGADGLVVLATPVGEEDDDPATSEGLIAQLPDGHGLVPGQIVALEGMVRERRPGQRASNLTTTELVVDGAPSVVGGGPLPAPVVLGAAGRPAPTGTIDDDSQGHVERPPVQFDPDQDALDWFESLEAMRVLIPEPVVVGSTSRYGECVVLADGGRDNPSLAPDGALVIAEGDLNPERLTVDDLFTPVPEVALGARFAGPLTGVVGYDWGTYRIQLTEPAPQASGGRPKDAAAPAPAGALRIASYNVENLSAAGPAWRFAAIARQIVERLASPDLLALQEIQDDSGPDDDGTVSGAGTLAALVEAIDAAGGPSYTAHEIPPVDGAEGGQPGGNIRVAYLLRSDADLELVNRPGGGPRVAVAVEDRGGRPALSHSPGRVAPTDAAWSRSRVPLAVELRWRGEPLFVIDNHWASKGGDDGLFGPVQPPVRHTEVRRSEQAKVVAGLVEQLLAVDPATRVIVTGDLNEFAFRPPVRTLVERTGLIDLCQTLPPHQRWTYVYQGNAQSLDHLLVSPGLRAAASTELRIVHCNAGWIDGASDHDPLLLTLVPRDD